MAGSLLASAALLGIVNDLLSAQVVIGNRICLHGVGLERLKRYPCSLFRYKYYYNLNSGKLFVVFHFRVSFLSDVGFYIYISCFNYVYRNHTQNFVHVISAVYL